MGVARGFVVPGISILLACLAVLPAKADDDGCARKVLGPHIERLEGWSLQAFRAGDDGVRMVLEAQGGRVLLVGLFRNESGLNTFQTMRGQEGDSSVSPEMSERLVAMYEAIDKDPAVNGCDQVRTSRAPSADAVYGELDALFWSLYKESASGGGSMPVTTIAVGIALVLLLAGLILARVRRRTARASSATTSDAASVPAEPASPLAATAASDEPDGPRPEA